MSGLDKKSIENLFMQDTLHRSKLEDYKANLLDFVGIFSKKCDLQKSELSRKSSWNKDQIMLFISANNREHVFQFYSISIAEDFEESLNDRSKTVEVGFKLMANCAIGHSSKIFFIKSILKNGSFWVISQLNNLILIQKASERIFYQKLFLENRADFELKTFSVFESRGNIRKYIFDEENWLHVIFEGKTILELTHSETRLKIYNWQIKSIFEKNMVFKGKNNKADVLQVIKVRSSHTQPKKYI